MGPANTTTDSGQAGCQTTNSLSGCLKPVRAVCKSKLAKSRLSSCVLFFSSNRASLLPGELDKPSPVVSCVRPAHNFPKQLQNCSPRITELQLTRAKFCVDKQMDTVEVRLHRIQNAPGTPSRLQMQICRNICRNSQTSNQLMGSAKSQGSKRVDSSTNHIKHQ